MDNPPEKQSRMSLWILFGIVVALVIAAIVLSVVLFAGGSEVPSLVGLNIGDATASLEDAGLSLGRQVYTAGLPEGAEEGEVVGQLPSAGTRVEKGTPVDVVVARGEQTVAMPLVVGLTRDEAVHTLQGVGLQAKTVDVVNEAEAGKVVDQSPAAGTKIGSGSEVVVMVSAGPAAR